MPDAFTHGYALTIGVGADLPITVADATGLYQVLVAPERAAYPPEHVELLTEETATRPAILAAFERLTARVNVDPDSTVIVYYSGHGGRLERPDGPTEYFLVPFGYNPARYQETALSGRDFTACIQALQARKLLVLLDCCHAGAVPDLKAPGRTFVKAPVPAELLSELETGSGQVVVASSHEDEYSYTGTPYSVFTKCLLQALAGQGSTTPDGFARILDVLLYLFKHVPQEAPGPQHPFVKKVLDLGDNFPICYYAGGSKQVPGQPAPVPAEPALAGASALTPRQRLRLEQERKGLEGEWDIRSQKVERLRAALAIEAGAAVRFQLEQQILEEETRLGALNTRLDELESALR